MADLRYPSLNVKDVPLFDASPNGLRVRAERYDEPGAESPTEASITDPTVRHRSRNSVLMADTAGDWSWKPARDKALGERMVTYRPKQHPLAGIRF